jgi:DNA gyrase subunit B
VAKKQEYNASSIKALDQRTHLIKRMSLTFGAEGGTPENPFSTQKSVAIREITDNSVDEVIGGYAERIKVSFFKDGSVEVQDNGRGLPVDIGVNSNNEKVSGIILTLGTINSGGKFSNDSTRFSGGLNGLGAASTNFVAARTDITVYRNNKKYTLSFKEGKPGFFDKPDDPEAKFTELTDLTYVKEEKDTRPAKEKKAWKTGTVIKTWLDENVFTSKYPVNRLDITERLRGTTFLLPGLEIEVYNEVDLIEVDGVEKPRVDKFKFEGGISELVKLNQNKDPLSEIIHLEARETYKEIVPVLQDNGQIKNEEVDRVVIAEVAMSWDVGYDYSMESYVNTIRTRLGGVHETAFERALTNAFTEKISSMRGMLPASMQLKPNFEDFSEGLTVVLSVKISEPQFTGQAKEELGGREAQRAIQKLLTDVFTKFANASKNDAQMRIIGKKISDATKAREAEKEARDIKRQKNKLESSTALPHKLVDCEITHTEDSELYIVEGDSARGALKAARYSSHQALLPIRGKIVNTNKQTLQKVLANQEVQDIIRSLDAGVGKDFDTDKLRYGRVFFGTDADVDGGAISVLLTMLFWDLFRPMIEEGRVYQLLTPLFLITPRKKGMGNLYALNDIEFEEITRKLDKDGIKYDVKRLKGLGEAGAKVLNETAMNPSTRTVKQITLTDIEKAQKMLDITLGSDVKPRKDWIERNPYEGMNLD